MSSSLKSHTENLKYVLDKRPEIVEYALEAVRRLKVEPLLNSSEAAMMAQDCHLWD